MDRSAEGCEVSGIRPAKVVKRPRLDGTRFIEGVLLLRPAAENGVAPLRWEKEIALIRDFVYDDLAELANREGMVALVLGERGGEGARSLLEVAVPEPRDLTPALSGEDAELHDGAEGVADFLGGLVDGSNLRIAENALAGLPADGLHALAGGVPDVMPSLRPTEKYFSGDECVVLFRDGLLQAVDLAIDVLWRDLGERLFAECEVAGEKPSVIPQGARLVFLLAGREE